MQVNEISTQKRSKTPPLYYSNGNISLSTVCMHAVINLAVLTVKKSSADSMLTFPAFFRAKWYLGFFEF